MLLLVAGCGPDEKIVRYTVDKPPPLEPLASADPHAGLSLPAKPSGEPTDRMLGAVIPATPQGWFFKLSGPKEAVAALEETFVGLVKSVRFDADGKPAWTLPDGWTQEPGNQIRYATLRIPASEKPPGKPLEVTVTALPNSGDDNASYVLQNVNRWRGQLQLPSVSQEQLAAESSEVKLEGATATLVNLVGHAAPNSMGRPPFASGAPDGN